MDSLPDIGQITLNGSLSGWGGVLPDRLKLAGSDPRTIPTFAGSIFISEVRLRRLRCTLAWVPGPLETEPRNALAQQTRQRRQLQRHRFLHQVHLLCRL